MPLKGVRPPYVSTGCRTTFQAPTAVLTIIDNDKDFVDPLAMLQELRDEGLPVLKTLLSASVRIKESHQKATPMIHFDRGHKLSQEFSALYKELTGGKRT